MFNVNKKENILEGCLPPACQPYVLRWLVLRWWPPDATGRGIPYLMSGGGGNRVPCLISRGWPGAFLYREVKYIMDNDHIATPCGQTDWQKHTTENISLAGGKNVIVFINGYGFSGFVYDGNWSAQYASYCIAFLFKDVAWLYVSLPNKIAVVIRRATHAIVLLFFAFDRSLKRLHTKMLIPPLNLAQPQTKWLITLIFNQKYWLFDRFYL